MRLFATALCAVLAVGTPCLLSAQTSTARTTTPTPEGSEAQYDRLWGKLNVAMIQFLTVRVEAFPARTEGSEALRLVDLARNYRVARQNLKAALSQLIPVRPPPHRVAMHRKLLPLYAELGKAMDSIVRTAEQNDIPAYERAWASFDVYADEIETALADLAREQAQTSGENPLREHKP